MCFVCLEFFKESNDELSKYIENIDNKFYEKVGQLHYDKARTIIKKDLYDLVEVNDVCYFSLLLLLYMFLKCYFNFRTADYCHLLMKMFQTITQFVNSSLLIHKVK